MAERGAKEDGTAIAESDQQDDAFRSELYRAALESKHHYDVLSWTVGGGTLVFVAGAVAYIPGVTGDGYWPTVLQRLPVGLFAILVLIGWYRVYDRNRLWGEVANEFMRKFERDRRFEGIALAFMKAHHDRGVTLANTDEMGKPYKGWQAHFESSAAGSMHGTVRWIVSVLILLVIGVCFLPKPSNQALQLTGPAAPAAER